MGHEHLRAVTRRLRRLTAALERVERVEAHAAGKAQRQRHAIERARLAGDGAVKLQRMRATLGAFRFGERMARDIARRLRADVERAGAEVSKAARFRDRDFPAELRRRRSKIRERVRAMLEGPKGSGGEE